MTEPGTAAEVAAAAVPVVAARSISKSFLGVAALTAVDFALYPGRIHAVVGENGAGKSTLMKILAGAIRPDAGVIEVSGQNANFRSPADALNAGIGIVYQELPLFPSLSVAENLVRIRGTYVGVVNWRAMRHQARQHLGQLGLNLDPEAPIGGLPIGEQQMVEIARVLFSGARVVILDEPTSALSQRESSKLFEFTHRLAERGVAIALVTHFLEDVMANADEVTVLKNGRVSWHGRLGKGVMKVNLVYHIVGAEAADLEKTYTGQMVKLPEPLQTEPLLEVKRLSSFPSFANISLGVRKGEVLGIYGDLASGLLQLAEAFFGRRRLESGEIRIDGQPVKLSSERKATRLGLGYVPGDRRAALALGQSVLRNMTLAHLDKMGGPFTRTKRERSVCRALIRKLSIRGADTEIEVGALSGGNQQKVLFARWLVHSVRVLILMEPTRGMDVGAKAEVFRIIKDSKAQGMAIVLLSSEPETVLAVADRVAVLSRGRIVDEFAGEDINKSILMRNT